PSVVAHVSRACFPGSTFIGLAPITILDPVSGVVPTQPEACAVVPVAEVATIVYSVAVVGVSFMLPLLATGAPLRVTVVAFAVVQLRGVESSAGLLKSNPLATRVVESRVSTSLIPPQPWLCRYVFR